MFEEGCIGIPGSAWAAANPAELAEHTYGTYFQTWQNTFKSKSTMGRSLI